VDRENGKIGDRFVAGKNNESVPTPAPSHFFKKILMGLTGRLIFIYSQL